MNVCFKIYSILFFFNLDHFVYKPFIFVIFTFSQSKVLLLTLLCLLKAITLFLLYVHFATLLTQSVRKIL